MRRLRRGFGCLAISLLFFCGVQAKDFETVRPCEAVDIRFERLSVGDDGIKRVLYAGAHNGGRLEVRFFTDDEDKALLDCGNEGCFGVFYNEATGGRFAGEFYCEAADADLQTVRCEAITGRLWKLSWAKDGVYEMLICGDVYRLEARSCDDCSCVVQKISQGGEVQEFSRLCTVGFNDVEVVYCMDTYGYDAYVGYGNETKDACRRGDVKGCACLTK